MRDFHGIPVVKTLPFNDRDTGLIPGQETRFPHASQSENKKENRNSIATNSIKIFKMGHIKKKKSL